MSLIFDLFFLLFLLAVGFAGVMFLLSQADKMGLVQLPRHKSLSGDEEGGQTTGKTANAIHWQRLYDDNSKGFTVGLAAITNSFIFRFAVVALLTGLMTIPLGMLKNFVKERTLLHRGVLKDISNIWGHKQKLDGPVIFVPFTEKRMVETALRNKKGKILYTRAGVERKTKKPHYTEKVAILLPEDLNIDVDLLKTDRKRGLYTAKVYAADLKINGKFKRPALESFSKKADVIHWDRAWVSLGISDTRAIMNISALDWEAVTDDKTGKKHKTEHKTMTFEPGTRETNFFKHGFHAALGLEAERKPKKSKKRRGKRRQGSSRSSKTKKDKKTIIYKFSMTMKLRGSRAFFFSPFGKSTNVSIASDWPHPSFQGNVLPNKHAITAKGFEANWHIPHLARNYPQFWVLDDQTFNIKEFSAGVNMFESISLYSKITRAIKYGILFVGLTFLTFLIFEQGIGRRLHMVQYGMVGVALTLFYLTLLSMAEHTGFFQAYLVAAGIIITMISLYAFAAIRKVGRTAAIALMLTGLYATLYTMLQLEDFALLSGTIMLLIVLAIMMFLTRNIGKSSHGSAGR